MTHQSASSALLELAEKVQSRCVVDANGCVIWQGSKNDRNYGQVWDGAKSRATHRVTFEARNGPIPEGMQIDHLCRNPPCCNPDHLEAVTPRENTLRGNAGLHRKIEAAAITHCPKGHSYDEENTYVSKQGKRQCKRCHNERQNAQRARMRALGIRRTA